MYDYVCYVQTFFGMLFYFVLSNKLYIMSYCHGTNFYQLFLKTLVSNTAIICYGKSKVLGQTVIFVTNEGQQFLWHLKIIQKITVWSI